MHTSPAGDRGMQNEQRRGGRVGRYRETLTTPNMNRIVTYTEEKRGIFSINCADCPLKPHLEALGMEPRPCVAGITTNVQGPVPIDTCEHYQQESIKLEENNLTINCTKE